MLKLKGMYKVNFAMLLINFISINKIQQTIKIYFTKLILEIHIPIIVSKPPHILLVSKNTSKSSNGF